MLLGGCVVRWVYCWVGVLLGGCLLGCFVELYFRGGLYFC